jgi:hypothetical protein
MRVFFDTNVYAAEALLGEIAELLIETTLRASWRIKASPYILEELERVLTQNWDSPVVWQFCPASGLFADPVWCILVYFATECPEIPKTIQS